MKFLLTFLVLGTTFNLFGATMSWTYYVPWTNLPSGVTASSISIELSTNGVNWQSAGVTISGSKTSASAASTATFGSWATTVAYVYRLECLTNSVQSYWTGYPTNGTSAGQTTAQTFYFYPGETSAGQACYTNICIKNPYVDRAINAYWRIKRDGVTLSQVNRVIQPNNSMVIVGTQVITGGESCQDLVYDCALDSLEWGYYYDAAFLTYDPTNGTWNVQSGVGDFALEDQPNQGGTNVAALLPPDPGLSSSMYNTNGPIAWNGQTNLDGILRSGFNMLGKQGNDAHRQREQMIAELKRLQNATNIGHDTTLHGILTNNYASTNAIHEGFTNLMGHISNATNVYNSIAGDLNSGLNTFSNIAQNFPDGSTTADLGWMNVELMGFNFDLNPLSNPGVAEMFTIAKKMFTWCFYALYVFAVIRRIEAVVKTLGTAQQGTVPNVEVSALGFGGNVGIIAAALIVPIFLLVIAVAFGWIGLEVSSWIAGDVSAALTQNPLSGYSYNVMSGLRLAGEFFPFPVVFGLLGAYLTWYAGSIGMIAFINATIRFTFGS